MTGEGRSGSHSHLSKFLFINLQSEKSLYEIDSIQNLRKISLVYLLCGHQR